MLLHELPDSTLNRVLGLDFASKGDYFAMLVKQFYPKIKVDSDKYKEMLGYYLSSFYVEKLYRSNMFFNEKFTVVYTKTGLIRNIIADQYYADDDLIIH